MKKILILGYYGFGNSGDDALLLSIIKDFERKGLKSRITVLSANPNETKKVYGVKAINRFNPFSLLYNFITSKLFLFGGGTLIQDGTSTKSLIYYLTMIRLSKLFGCKTILYANGIGPINRRNNKRRSELTLNKADTITVRDRRSLGVLKDVNITKPEIILTADPVFLLDVESDIDYLKRKYNIDNNIICVAVRSPKGNYPNFASDIATALDNANEKYGMKAVLMPFQGIDLEISKKIVSLMKNEAVLIEEKLEIGEVMSLVKMSRMCIGMRLHMLIYAASKATPVVGIVYDPKVSGFMEYAKQNLYVDLSELDDKNLTSLIESCINDEDNIRKSLDRARAELRSQAEKNIEAALKLYQE